MHPYMHSEIQLNHYQKKKKEWANIHSNFDEGKKSHMEQKKPDPPQN